MLSLSIDKSVTKNAKTPQRSLVGLIPLGLIIALAVTHYLILFREVEFYGRTGKEMGQDLWHEMYIGSMVTYGTAGKGKVRLPISMGQELWWFPCMQPALVQFRHCMIP